MVDNKRLHRFGWALLYSAVSTANAQDFVQICGSDYMDAVENCNSNPLCPSGDGCPTEQSTCFVLPSSSCPDAVETDDGLGIVDDGSVLADDGLNETGAFNASVPTASPSMNVTEYHVCAFNFQDAIDNCQTNTPCPDFDIRLCPATTACFAVPSEQCPGGSVGGDSGLENTTDSTVAPTPAGTPVKIPDSYKVCANDFDSAMAGCPFILPECTGSDCDVGEACFEVPAVMCSNATSTPTESPTPQFLYVCGQNYTDASNNCREYDQCPTGDGCAIGTCFAIPYTACPEEEPITSPIANATESPSGSPVNSTNVPTISPSKSPTPNTLFCGETYQDAEQNCFTATPCPNGSGCPAGEACFGISIPKCVSAAPTAAPTNPGPQPTDGPTVSPMPSVAATTMAPTAPQTPSPSASPIVNQNYCGIDYFDAAENCASSTPCPDGVSCPSGQTCFPGITCAALAVPSATTPSPSVTGGVGGSAMPSPVNGTSLMPSMNSTQVTPSPTQALRFCGTDPDDAKNNCAVNLPCPPGVGCPVGQACFPLDEPCQPKSNQTITPAPSPVNVTSSIPANATTLAPVAPDEVASNGTIAPTLRPTSKPVFDPSVTNFCGTGWDDTVANCFYQQQCPGGESSECPDGLTCFVGIVGCKIPPTMAPTRTPGSVTGGENETTAVETSPPTIRRTPPPTFDWTAIPPSGARGIWNKGLMNILSVGSGIVISLVMLW